MAEIAPKKARVNGQMADEERKKTKSPLETKCSQPTAGEYLFQRLGNDMADRLVCAFQSVPDPLDLVRRLTVAQWSTALSTSASMTTTPGSDLTIHAHAQSLLHFTVSHMSLSPTNHSYPSTLPKWKKGSNIFSLDDFAAIAALESLIERYGRVSHMGILDKSYSFFLSRTGDAALYFKVKNKTAVVGGDPLCRPDQFPAVLEEFKKYRKKNGLAIAFLGASDRLMRFAREQKWVTMHFAEECVLNPMTNPVLLESAGKRIIGQNKQLLDPSKGNITIELYSPATGTDLILQEQLVDIYESWREERNRQRKGRLQAFITVYDPFALPALMIYIYTKGPDGRPNGFAALRKLGANSGFHIDPCIAARGAPRGVTDLLVFAAMSLLNHAGISYLSLGYEPMPSLRDITGMPKLISNLIGAAYRRTIRALPVSGKKAYHDKFRPDKSQQSGLHILFPDGIPGPRHSMAVMHVANVKVRRLIVPDWPGLLGGRRPCNRAKELQTGKEESTGESVHDLN